MKRLRTLVMRRARLLPADDAATFAGLLDAVEDVEAERDMQDDLFNHRCGLLLGELAWEGLRRGRVRWRSLSSFEPPWRRRGSAS